MCMHVMTWEFFHIVAFVYASSIRTYSYMLNKNSLGLLKKGAAKQNRIKNIVWYLRLGVGDN